MAWIIDRERLHPTRADITLIDKHWQPQPGEQYKLAYKAPKAWRRIPPSSTNERGDRDRERALKYARWLAERDGITLPASGRLRAEWSGVYSPTRKGARGQAIYERRIRALLWGRTEPRYNTRKDGRQGAWICDEFVTEFRFELPNWDFNPCPIDETEAAPMLEAAE